MKKLLQIVVCVLILTGCQSGPGENTKSSKINIAERRIGEIQSLGRTFSSAQASHILKMMGGKTILLRSDNINLNDESYKDKTVEVTGEVLLSKDNKDLMVVKSIDVLESDQSIVVDPPQWQDFSSETMKISFKYRDDYILDEFQELIKLSKSLNQKVIDQVGLDNFSGEKVAKVIISLSKDCKFDSLEKFAEVESLDVDQLAEKGFSKSRLGEGYYDAIKKTTDTKNEYEYFTVNDGCLLNISFKIENPEEDQIYTSETNYFYDLLASIKLGEGIDLSTQRNLDDRAAISDEEAKINLSDELVHEQEENLESDSLDTQGQPIESNLDLTGFTQFSSSSLNFSIYYPSSYYFDSVAASSGELRAYGFGKDPLEVTDPEIRMSIVTGTVPSGQNVTSNDKAAIKVTENDIVSYFLKTSSGKTYRVSGPSIRDSILRTMIFSISE